MSVYTILRYNLYYREPVSISTTLEQAKGGHVDSFLALTDSIVGTIKCCPLSLARSDSPELSESDKKAIKKVF
jgi:hypothetical protein